jgi:hypothetical protein
LLVEPFLNARDSMSTRIEWEKWVNFGAHPTEPELPTLSDIIIGVSSFFTGLILGLTGGNKKDRGIRITSD